MQTEMRDGSIIRAKDKHPYYTLLNRRENLTPIHMHTVYIFTVTNVCKIKDVDML